jgi:hypothetical protein
MCPDDATFVLGDPRAAVGAAVFFGVRLRPRIFPACPPRDQTIRS